MAKLTFERPFEFTDEDRWFKYFTKKDLAVLIVTGALTVFLYKLTAFLLGKPLIGLIIGVLIIAASLFCSMFKLPETMYLSGGRQTIATILLRRFIRKKDKVIYTRGYSDWEDE